VRAINLSRRHLSQDKRRELIAEQLKDTPEKSNNQIAGALGVSDTTVGTVRSELESASQIGKLKTTVGADGKVYPARRSVMATTKNEAERALHLFAATDADALL